jgi:hypothetical protein
MFQRIGEYFAGPFINIIHHALVLVYTYRQYIDATRNMMLWLNVTAKQTYS